MKLKSRALKSRENDSNNEEPPKRTRRLKRVIIEESSSEGSDSSNDEDDVPLFQRKAVKNTLDKKGPIIKKIRLSTEENLAFSTLEEKKTKPLSAPMAPPGFKAPSSEFKVPRTPPSKGFKTTMASPEFKTPSNEFKAPIAPFSNGFKAPMTTDFKAPMPEFTENQQSNRKYNSILTIIWMLTLLQSNIK